MRPILALAVSLAATQPAGSRECLASWYGAESGHRTASGAVFHPDGRSVALRSRAFGHRYRVAYRGRAIVALHNDFGPAAWTGRCADLSAGAARAIGLTGVGKVSIQRID
ncbi:MAG TPA: septal ring lytic transglycosylase RlpA family protein [Methylocella sp.]|nr:septal ring lytic transglycosylase RlpA family protein [Methylocella sp.]